MTTAVADRESYLLGLLALLRRLIVEIDSAAVDSWFYDSSASSGYNHGNPYIVCCTQDTRYFLLGAENYPHSFGRYYCFCYESADLFVFSVDD